ncbi:hypothetical protein ABT186_38355 [Streptomyces sp. NPDC001634]|uniref:hypothetical protein n=1 Tax=Streptomyces sp. NPDC001634 TaxID=3154390 RepID=UPI0033220693
MSRRPDDDQHQIPGWVAGLAITTGVIIIVIGAGAVLANRNDDTSAAASPALSDSATLPPTPSPTVNAPDNMPNVVGHTWGYAQRKLGDFAGRASLRSVWSDKDDGERIDVPTGAQLVCWQNVDPDFVSPKGWWFNIELHLADENRGCPASYKIDTLGYAPTSATADPYIPPPARQPTASAAARCRRPTPC